MTKDRGLLAGEASCQQIYYKAMFNPILSGAAADSLCSAKRQAEAKVHIHVLSVFFFLLATEDR